MANQTENKNQGYNNLKSIYQLQSGGAMQVLLRDLRSVKIGLEDVMKSAYDKKKKLAFVKQQSQNDENKTSEKIVEPVVEKPVEIEIVKEPKKVQEEPQEVSMSMQDVMDQMERQSKKNNDYRNANNQRNQNQTNRQPFNKQQSQQFDRRRDFSRERPQNNFSHQNGYNRQNNNGQNRDQNQNRRPFQQGDRPFNRPFNPNNKEQRPFAPRNNNFVSSKANTFKKFEPTESSAVLSQPERNFGNKNKSNRQIEEKKQINKKSLLRRNILVSDRDGDDFDGERMGSRKLVKTKKKEQQTFVAPAIESAIITSETVTVKILSEKTGKPVTEIIKKLMILGIMATINSSIDFMTAQLVAEELGVKLEQKLEKTYEQQLMDVSSSTDSNNLVKRPPVVTVMGHVDHGQTSLLDAIRKTNVVSGEAGGITQKIGAYQITWNNEKITFIDTPGHAAFTAMRARGAKVTDIAILVVAADDGLMPQTIEAINHIKAAEVPMVVAINKMDKPEANPERVKQQLAENGVLPEEWGGDAILVPISAKKGIGIDKLLENVLLVAEMEELKADPDTTAVGTVIEAELDKNRGPIATVLIESGTLKVGDSIMSGISYGKVRAMYDENNKPVKKATPSTPVSILGLDSVPNSGDKVFAVEEKLSKQVIEERISKLKEQRANSTSGVSLEDFMNKVNEGKLKALNIIIKADVQGSVEALKQTLTSIKNEEAKVVCIHSGAGAVTESDLVLAEASGAVIINFNLKLQGKIEQMADSLKVQVKSYKVIYEVVEEITKALTGMLTVKYEEKTIGHAEVRVMFKLSTNGLVCGSYVKDGKITRNSYIRVIRDGEIIANTQVDALKIQKDDKSEINYGYECGIKLKDATGVVVGDILEAFEKVEIKRG